jgi:hypothetical protein
MDSNENRMKTRIIAVPVVLLWLALTCGLVLGGGKDVCVSISDMSRGRNCGSGDSVQVDVKNDCGVKVTGFLIFRQASGDPIRYAVTLNSGDHHTAFACHGNGTVDKDFDVGRQ